MKMLIDKQVEKFIASLESITIAKVLRTIDLLEQFGRNLRMPHSKHVSTGIFELRIRGQQEIRIFYIFKNRDIVLLHAYIKKTQKTPQSELRKALKKFRA